MYRFTIEAPKADGQRPVTWKYKGRLEASAAVQLVPGGWIAEVALDIAPVINAVGPARRVPFDLMVTDYDKGQIEPTYALWSGTREMHDLTNAWGGAGAVSRGRRIDSAQMSGVPSVAAEDTHVFVCVAAVADSPNYALSQLSGHLYAADWMLFYAAAAGCPRCSILATAAGVAMPGPHTQKR